MQYSYWLLLLWMETSSIYKEEGEYCITVNSTKYSDTTSKKIL